MTYAYLYQWENAVRECITAMKDASAVIQHVMHFSVAVCWKLITPLIAIWQESSNSVLNNNYLNSTRSKFE